MFRASGEYVKPKRICVFSNVYFMKVRLTLSEGEEFVMERFHYPTIFLFDLCVSGVSVTRYGFCYLN